MLPRDPGEQKEDDCPVFAKMDYSASEDTTDDRRG
jgi:hypothetical protein